MLTTRHKGSTGGQPGNTKQKTVRVVRYQDESQFHYLCKLKNGTQVRSNRCVYAYISTHFLSLVAMPLVFEAVQTSNFQRPAGLSFLSAAQIAIGSYLGSPHSRNNASLRRETLEVIPVHDIGTCHATAVLLHTGSIAYRGVAAHAGPSDTCCRLRGLVMCGCTLFCTRLFSGLRSSANRQNAKTRKKCETKTILCNHSHGRTHS